MREQMLLDRTAVLKSLVLCEISTYHVQILAANPGLERVPVPCAGTQKGSLAKPGRYRYITVRHDRTRAGRRRAAAPCPHDALYLIG